MTTAFRTSRGCGRDDCDDSQLEKVNVLCRTHGALLILAGISPRLRFLLGAVVCVVPAVGFFIAPMIDSPVPVFLVLAGAGLAVVAPPLRLFPVAGRAVVAGWVVACVLAFVLSRPEGGAFRPALTVIALLVALGWALRLGLSAVEINGSTDSAGDVEGAAFIATCLGVAGGAGVLWLATAGPGDDTAARLPHALSTPLAWIAWLTIIFGALALGGFAAVRGTARWSDRAARLIKSPARPKRMASWDNRNRPTGRRRSALDRLLDALSHTSAQLVFSVADLLVYVLYYWTLRILVAVTNWLIMWLVAILEIAARAIILLFLAAVEATRLIVLPAAGLLIAAVLILFFSGAQVDYAQGGSAADIVPLIGYATAAYCLLTLAWTALSGLWPGPLVDTIVDLTGYSVAIALVAILLGGWLFGILGWLGYGTYHIGLATITCTVLLVLIVTARRLRTKIRAATAADDGHRLAPRHGVVGGAGL